MYYYVEFHADGGCTCIKGLRRFVCPNCADAFAELVRNEPGHSCGEESVTTFESEEFIEESGFLTLDKDKHPSHDEKFYQKQLLYTTNDPK